MATHSSILAWRIPWTEEPGELQSMGSQSRTQLSNFHFIILNIIFVYLNLNLPGCSAFIFAKSGNSMYGTTPMRGEDSRLVKWEKLNYEAREASADSTGMSRDQRFP